MPTNNEVADKTRNRSSKYRFFIAYPNISIFEAFLVRLKIIISYYNVDYNIVKFSVYT